MGEKLDRLAILFELKESVTDMVNGRGRYERALVSAKDSGMTYQEIADVLGRSEAGVRLFLKRHGYERKA